MMGVIQASAEVTLLKVDCELVDVMLGVLRNSTGTTSKSLESLVDASRARAFACVFCSLGTYWILKKLNPLNKSLAFHK